MCSPHLRTFFFLFFRLFDTTGKGFVFVTAKEDQIQQHTKSLVSAWNESNVSEHCGILAEAGHQWRRKA